MTKKLTVTVTDEVYKGLHSRVGRRKISRFINDLARERLADRNSPEYWLSAPERELAALCRTDHSAASAFAAAFNFSAMRQRSLMMRFNSKSFGV